MFMLVLMKHDQDCCCMVGQGWFELSKNWDHSKYCRLLFFPAILGLQKQGKPLLPGIGSEPLA